MRILIEEYFDILLTIIGGLIIIGITISTIITIDVPINHVEERNKFDLQIEGIGVFKCKDVLLNSENQDLLKDVEAYSNSNINIKDKVIARIKEDSSNKQYVEYVLKYCDDYKILKANLYIEEENE